MDQVVSDHLKSAVEALLFVSEKSVTVDQLKDAVAGSTAADIRLALEALKGDYDKAVRGMCLVEIAGGWQMLSSPACVGYIREFYKTRHKEKLSRAALETLAIIAYKQPVSRADVEAVRGVNSDGTVMHLLNKGLVRISGRKEVPGRPYVYATTNQFLEYFGLRALEDLPKLEDFPALMAAGQEAGAPADQVATGPGPVMGTEPSGDAESSGETSGQARLMAAENAGGAEDASDELTTELKGGGHGSDETAR